MFYPFKYTKFKFSGGLKCAEIDLDQPFDYKLSEKLYLVESCNKKKVNNYYLNKNLFFLMI